MDEIPSAGAKSTTPVYSTDEQIEMTQVFRRACIFAQLVDRAIIESGGDVEQVLCVAQQWPWHETEVDGD